MSAIMILIFCCLSDGGCAKLALYVWLFTLDLFTFQTEMFAVLSTPEFGWDRWMDGQTWSNVIVAKPTNKDIL